MFSLWQHLVHLLCYNLFDVVKKKKKERESKQLAVKDEAWRSWMLIRPLKSCVIAYRVNMEEHLALSILGACCVYSNRFNFGQRIAASSSPLIPHFFSHNNWKHLCAVKYPIRLRNAPIISVEPQQKRFSSAPGSDYLGVHNKWAPCTNYFSDE